MENNVLNVRKELVWLKPVKNAQETSSSAKVSASVAKNKPVANDAIILDALNVIQLQDISVPRELVVRCMSARNVVQL